MKRNKNKVTCRPCKEQNNWEIEIPNGEVLVQHYSTKAECVREGRHLAEEYGCELDIQDHYSY